MSSTIIFSSVLVALYSLLWFQQSSWTYYAYAFFPVMFWEEVVARRQALVAGRKILVGRVESLGEYVGIAVQAVVFVGVIEAVVSGLSFWLSD